MNKNQNYIKNTLPKAATKLTKKERLEKLTTVKDEDIDFSDIPILDKKFWKNAKIVHPDSKERISININRKTLEWFRLQGKGYQKLINSILDSYAKHHLSS